jgi:hypothetical protein
VSTETLDAIKVAVAAQHGLDADAAGFLTGESVEEFEESASKLARLVEAHRLEQEPAPPGDAITAALAGKQQRKRELAAMFAGRPKAQQQPRDAHGRFARGSFEGGVTRPLAPARDPITDHDRAVTALASLASTFRGTSF